MAGARDAENQISTIQEGLMNMTLQRRTEGEVRAYVQGFNAAIEYAAKRMEEANEETSRQFIIQAIRDMRQPYIKISE